jgi:hypothetical protein
MAIPDDSGWDAWSPGDSLTEGRVIFLIGKDVHAAGIAHAAVQQFFYFNLIS